MREPIREALERHAEDISFHTPAHNGGILNNSLAAAKYDITELAYSDNLLSPEGIIMESEKEVAGVYGTERVVYSTAGATALIHSAIYSTAERGAFLVYGNAHKSVYNALRRAGAECYYYRGKRLGEALIRSGAKTLVITTPDYYGNDLNCAEIAEAARRAGAKTIADASHGGHYRFSLKLPDSATDYFDLVIHSLHKTLPVLTGGAVIHVKEEDAERFMRAFREVHTTSPSYPVMASIEGAVALMEREGEKLYAGVLERIEEFKMSLSGLPLEVVSNDDPTRLVLKVKEGNALALAARLEDRGVYPECYDFERVVFIVTPFNADKLGRAAEILAGCDYSGERLANYVPAGAEEFGRLTFGARAESVPLSEGRGRVLYEGIGVYPPGTPIVRSGEVLDGERYAVIEELSARGDLSLFGIEKGNVVVLK